MPNFVPGMSTSPAASAFAAIGGRPNIHEYRILYEEADVPSLNAALKRWDRVCAEAAEQRRRHPIDIHRKAAAEVAYRDEQRQAMIEGRAPTLDYASVTTAEAADSEAHALHAAAADSEDQALLMVAAELRTHPADVLHAIAKARPGALAEIRQAELTSRHGDDRVRRRYRPARRVVENLFKSMVHPPVAYRPGHVGKDSFYEWWPLVFDGTRSVPERLRRFAVEWNEWLWNQLAGKRGKSWSTDENGVLHFAKVWTPSDPTVLRPTVDFFNSTPSYRTDDMVMLGTGPNGEPGATRWQTSGTWMTNP